MFSAVCEGSLLLMEERASLASLPTPRSWWSNQPYVCEDSLSRTLSEFRCGNARLGDRDDSLSLEAVPNHQGRLVVCPLCLQGPYCESHLLYSFARLTGFHSSRFVWVRFPCSLRLMPSASLALLPRISPNAFWGMVAPSPSVSSSSAGSCLRTSVKNSGSGPWPPPCLGWPLPLSSGFHILLF